MRAPPDGFVYNIISALNSERKNRMQSIVAESGQLPIPAEVRDKLGITPGMVLDVREEDGKLIAVKVLQDDPVSRVRGRFNLGMSTDDFLQLTRGEP